MEPFAYRIVSEHDLGRYRIELGELETPEGASPYSIVHMKPFSCCLASVEGKVAFVRQYRYSVASWQLELPAGGVEPGESPVDAARRELLEETGLVAEDLIDLGFYYPSVGSTDEVCHVFAARCEGVLQGKQLDRGESTELVLVEREEVERMLDGADPVYPGLCYAWLKLIRMGVLDQLFPR